jgi:serine/threonine protein kinase
MDKKNDNKERLSSQWKLIRDKYKLLDVLGEGTFGKVIKARVRETGKLVAIKFIEADFTAINPIRNIIRELQILRQFTQMKDNIFTTKLLDIKLASKSDKLGQATGIFIVMDYVPYDVRTLLEKVDQDQFTREHITIILYNLLCATNFMHSAGLMHRDIKPCNLLVDSECSVRICDFGQSRPFFEPADFANNQPQYNS